MSTDVNKNFDTCKFSAEVTAKIIECLQGEGVALQTKMPESILNLVSLFADTIEGVVDEAVENQGRISPFDTTLFKARFKPSTN